VEQHEKAQDSGSNFCSRLWSPFNHSQKMSTFGGIFCSILMVSWKKIAQNSLKILMSLIIIVGGQGPHILFCYT